MRPIEGGVRTQEQEVCQRLHGPGFRAKGPRFLGIHSREGGRRVTPTTAGDVGA